MLFIPSDCKGTKCHHFSTIEFIHNSKPITDFFNFSCLQLNLQNPSTEAGIDTLKLLTELYSQQFVQKLNQSSLIIIVSKILRG